MHILVTNDDGINSPGIRKLWQALAELGQVTVAAPDIERSAASQSITVHTPIKVEPFYPREPQISGWTIGGTPPDCVKIAIETLLPQPPDLIVSGINNGSNLGTDVLYSGTVSAAIEGALHEIPAIAISLDTWEVDNYDFNPAALFAKQLIKKMAGNKLPPRTLLNVNVPAKRIDQIPGVAITKLGIRQYENTFERRFDQRGHTYYWLGGMVVDQENDPDTDVSAIKEGKISITPIHFDLTNYPIMQSLQTWKLNNLIDALKCEEL